jgi:hypothetical protein
VLHAIAYPVCSRRPGSGIAAPLDLGIGGGLLDVSQHRHDGRDPAPTREQDNASVQPFVEMELAVGSVRLNGQAFSRIAIQEC